MRCPKCHAEVEKGNLFCPKCLAEIPWVQEYNSVETLLKKNRIKNPEEFIRKRQRMLEKIETLKKAVITVLAFLIILAIAFAYRQTHTFSSIYEKASAALDAGKYDRALSLMEAALGKDPDSLEGNLLLSRIQEERGDLQSAILVMTPVLKAYPDSVDAYRQMLALLEKDGQYDEIRELLAGCESQKVLNGCRDYICATPVSSLPPGTYTSVQTVSLTADYDQIYYTLDGTEPTRESTRYTGPILLEEGRTVLKALGVNEHHVASDVITREYVLVMEKPDPPAILPETGDYFKKTMIEIEVPDGCRAYYAFDEIPTVQSTVYEKPIQMPEGYHVFYAVLVAANGEVSDTASRIYYLEY